MNQKFYNVQESLQVNEMLLAFPTNPSDVQSWLYAGIINGVSLAILLAYGWNAYLNDPLWKHCRKTDDPPRCRSKARIRAARKLLKDLAANYQKFKSKKDTKSMERVKKGIEAQKARIEKWERKHKEKYNETV